MDHTPATRATRPPALRAVVVVAALALLAVVAGCGSDDAPELAGMVRDPALDVGGVAMPGPTGDEIAMRADDDGLLVVYFGYTSCPDICPTTMSDLKVGLSGLDADRSQRVTVAFATVDPDRDTIEVIEGYLGHFFDSGLALRTEDPAALDAAAEAFGVEFQVADHEPGERTYDVAHTAVTYVIDDTGTVVVEWPFGFESADMTRDLNTLLEEDA